MNTSHVRTALLFGQNRPSGLMLRPPVPTRRLPVHQIPEGLDIHLVHRRMNVNRNMVAETCHEILDGPAWIEAMVAQAGVRQQVTAIRVLDQGGMVSREQGFEAA